MAIPNPRKSRPFPPARLLGSFFLATMESWRADIVRGWRFATARNWNRRQRSAFMNPTRLLTFGSP